MPDTFRVGFGQDLLPMAAVFFVVMEAEAVMETETVAR
jgi:hypothetical protein